MTLETYWLIVPLIGIGLSGFGWLALWMTRHRETRGHTPAETKALPHR